MIENKESLEDIRESWNGVQKLKAFENRCALTSGGVVSLGHAIPDGFWNLPFFLAYSILDDVLYALTEQGFFLCKSRQLGARMESSKGIIPWVNFELILAGKESRNDLAHRAVVLSKKECFKYILAIEAELKSWGILID